MGEFDKTTPNPKTAGLHPLAELLAGPCAWPARDSLQFARQLVIQLGELHQAGRIHRAIRADTVLVDAAMRPQLAPPPETVRFAQGTPDLESCPAEMGLTESIDLPAEIEQARAVLAAHGQSLDPRRIDLYQLGAILARLFSGESIFAYLFTPTAKAKVPIAMQPLLASLLGDDGASPLFDADAALEAIDAAMQRLSESAKPEEPAIPFERLGQFRIIGRLGQGGMGEVYKAHDESLDRIVAIKVMPADLARDAGFRRRFMEEAETASRLSHLNIVPILFVNGQAERPFFVMEWIDGESLAERLAHPPRIPTDEAVRIVEDCLAGLEAAHAQKLIHRDIKPGNILLDRQTGRAVLADFGLVRRLDATSRLTQAGFVIGTLGYIAPEQCRGPSGDERSDIYSLGVVFYEMLAGRLPFVAESMLGTLFQHAFELPEPLQKVAPDAPGSLVAIIHRMMAKEPADRYATCSAVLADLQAYREGRPIEAAPMGNSMANNSATQGGGRARRQGWIAGAGGVIALLTAVGWFAGPKLWPVSQSTPCPAGPTAGNRFLVSRPSEPTDWAPVQEKIARLSAEQFAEVTVESAGTFEKLEEGARFVRTPGRVPFWKPIPPFLADKVFLYNQSGYQGETRFTVTRPGVVVLGMSSRWGGGGGVGPDLAKKMTRRDDFLAMGWQRVGTAEITDPDIRWEIYWRDCQAGEQFDLQNEKYAAPIIFLPASRKSSVIGQPIAEGETERLPAPSEKAIR